MTVTDAAGAPGVSGSNLLLESRNAGWVRAAASGDREAFGLLVEAHWAGLVALARSVLAGRNEGEDVVQDALVLAWQRLATLRDPERFPVWVRRIVVRGCLRFLRQSRKLSELPDLMVTPPTGVDRVDLQRALRMLSPRQRAVMHLTAEGRSDTEIAGILGIFPSTARVHRSRAARRLRQILGGEP
ncbi:MAG: sigma-70 family RNA polymerase sigma factor [Acidobacteriota bacterium]